MELIKAKQLNRKKNCYANNPEIIRRCRSSLELQALCLFDVRLIRNAFYAAKIMMSRYDGKTVYFL